MALYIPPSFHGDCKLTQWIPVVQTHKKQNPMAVTTMRLVHQTERGIKTLPLGPIHRQLEQSARDLETCVGSRKVGNLLLSRMIFCCSIKKGLKYQEEFISFDLKMPTSTTLEKTVISYDTMVAKYQGEEKLLEKFKSLDDAGKTRGNHGHQVTYVEGKRNEIPYIRHTEPEIVAYLELPEAAVMLRNRLITQIRQEHSDATAVEVGPVVLAMHSTKSCCARCESILNGLLKQGLLVNHFKQACSGTRDERLPVTTARSFRLAITVGVKKQDADHRAEPDYVVRKLAGNEFPYYDICLNEKTTYRQIYASRIDSKSKKKQPRPSTNLTDFTVAISGSAASKRPYRQITEKVEDTREGETDNWTLSHFFTRAQRQLKFESRSAS